MSVSAQMLMNIAETSSNETVVGIPGFNGLEIEVFLA